LLWQWHQAICEIARVHSKEMADGVVPFGHTGFERRVSKVFFLIDISTLYSCGHISNLVSSCNSIPGIRERSYELRVTTACKGGSSRVDLFTQ
jgi:hypothetical protein